MTGALSGEFTKQLSEIVGEQYVTDDPVTRFTYTRDASLFGGTQSALVVRPGSTDEVSRIAALCNRYRVPIVTRGGGATIYGQPKGDPDRTVLLDMTRMDRVLEVNAESMTVTAEAGIILGKMVHACKKNGFYMWSPFAPLHMVSLGGWISGVAGAAGLWTDIVSITVVLADGTIVKTGGGPGTNVHQPLAYNRNLGGPDFGGMFIGDGGSFGIKTQATIRMTKHPARLRAGIFAFDAIEPALELVRLHVERRPVLRFDPVLVFGAGAMKNFMGDTDEVAPFTVQAMIQGHEEAEVEARLATINSLADQCGAQRNFMLDAMAEAMGTPTGEESEMDWMAIFNSFGIPAWLPFNLPRQGFAEVYKKLIAWRNARLKEADKLGLRIRTTWEFFTASDPSTIVGEIDVFLADVDNPVAIVFARTLMADFQKYAHSLGSIDVYNQGFMSDLNASCWSPGFKSLFEAVKGVLDPHGILNPGQWTGSYLNEKEGSNG
jgi:FAD/FMN-containing dehydrogenase